MIEVKQGGPGEVEVELIYTKGELTWMDTLPEVSGRQALCLWLDPRHALDLANKLMDIVQAMDDAEKDV